MAVLGLVKALFPLAILPVITAQCTPNTDTANGIKPVADQNWKWAVVASNLPNPRSLEFDANGRLVVVQSGTGLTALELTTDEGICVKERSRKTVVNNGGLNHGLTFSKDGKTIYASTSEAAYSWAYDPAAVIASGQEIIVKGMNNPDHSTRTLLKSRFAENMLLVSRGSNDNIDPGAAYLESGRSQIKAFDVTKVPTGGYDFATSGTRLGWGLRNSVGVSEHPARGDIYSVENSSDNLKRDGVDVHQNNPGEEMNYHGTLVNNRFAGQGGNYGYPNCFAAWDPGALPNNQGLRIGSPFANSSSLDSLCKDTIPPRLTFQAHMAPLDIKFNNSGTEGWVTFHGSWNRDNPAGYKIGVIGFDRSRPRQFSGSFRAVFDVLTNADNSKCPDNCFRPAGMAFDRFGRLFFSSDKSGEIYVVVKT